METQVLDVQINLTRSISRRKTALLERIKLLRILQKQCENGPINEKKLQVKASRTMMDFVFKDFFGVASQKRSRKIKGVKIPFEMDGHAICLTEYSLLNIGNFVELLYYQELIASIGRFQKVSKTGI